MIAPFSPHPPAQRFTSHGGNSTVYCNGAVMRAYCRNEITVVHITGEIDATNVDRLYDYTHRFASAAQALIINLSEVDFLCARGIFVLHAVGNNCRTEGRTWVIVTSPAVDRLLSIGDPNHTLPTTGSERRAVTTLSGKMQGALAAS